jgi:hypothetical protein
MTGASLRSVAAHESWMLDLRCFPGDDNAFRDAVALQVEPLAGMSPNELARAAESRLSTLRRRYPALRVAVAPELACTYEEAIVYVYRDGTPIPSVG